MAELLGEILVASGLLSEEDLALALTRQEAAGGRLGEVLSDLGLVSRIEVSRALATQLGAPALAAGQLAVDDGALARLTLDFCTGSVVAPVRRGNGELRLAMAEPVDDELYARALERVPELAGRAVALAPDILAALATRLPRSAALDVLSGFLPSRRMVELIPGGEGPGDRLEDAETVRIAAWNALERIIADALFSEAEEVLLDPRPAGALVRYRVAGRLRDGIVLPTHTHPALVAAVREAAGAREVSTAGSARGHFRVTDADRTVDIQATVTRTGRGTRCLLRLLPGEEPGPTLDEAGVPSVAQDFLYTTLSSEGGVILLTGMLSRGRKVTLRACLSWISMDECNVVAVEDTYALGGLPGVARIDAGAEAGGTAGAIRLALQQDPDVLVVAQVRDRESTELALEAALDGRTVLCGIPACNTVEALRRLLDMGVNRRLLAHAFSMCLSHHALRRVCENCRIETQPTSMALAEMARILGREPRGPFYAGAGCEECMSTGYNGTLSVYGALRSDARVRGAITRGLAGDELRAAMSPFVFVSAAEAGLEQARAGYTTADELTLHLLSSES